MKKWKSILMCLSVMSFCFMTMPCHHLSEKSVAVMTAKAADYSGTCGENASWEFDPESGNLHIFGNGEMDSVSPWSSFLTDIRTVTIDEGITTIGEFAFTNCENLTSVSLPDSLIWIGICSFSFCPNLTEVTIPEQVLYIGEMAFMNCSALEEISIPSNVMMIGECAFSCTSALTAIHVDENNQDYADEDGVLMNKEKNILIQYPCKKKDSTYTLPDSMKTINMYAFWNCKNLFSINIPDGVTEIEAFSFQDCVNLTLVNIPHSVTSLQKGVFSNCSHLESILIPDGITEIGDYAFQNCSNLKRIDLPESVAQIGERAFNGCDALSSIVIRNSDCIIFDDENTLPEWAVINASPGSSAMSYAEKYVRMSQDIPEFHFHLYGDANSDGKIDLSDVVKINKVVLGKDRMSDEELTAIDFNGNNRPDAEESLLLLKYILGVVTNLKWYN